MKGILPAFYAKRFSFCLVAALIALSFVAGTSEAMFVPADPQNQSAPLYDRAADLARIQRTLESKALEQRLTNFGLSPADALAKINGLSNEQIHQFASNIDAVQAGGMRDSNLIIILLLIILIIVII
jgi:hypothetical protein